MNKKFYRSSKDKVFAGVCGGIGEYFNIDPVLVRVLFFILLFVNGIGLILYLLLMLITPKEPTTIEMMDAENKDRTEEELSSITNEKFQTANKTRQIFGIILLVIGILFLIDNLVPYFDLEFVIPIALIIFGLYLIIKSKASK